MPTILSMTGFGSAARELPQCSLAVELRSVNSRYLDIVFRLPEELRSFEPQLRELLSARVQRGKVELRATLTELSAAQRTLDINTDLVRRLAGAAREVQALVPEAKGLSTADILRWPGVIGEPEVSPDALGAAFLAAAQAAVGELVASRAREGEKLQKLMLDRVASMQQLVEGVAPRIPQIVTAYGEKLAARIAEAMGGKDDDRIRQELVLFAAKIDVDEELSRLGAHFKELRRILNAGGSAGRRLDFLMQELNRESNTLGSKSVDLELTQVSVELKVLIEQMREQVQNIE
jgi:uncharacterized protein (TIGR00255 family)